MPGKLPALNPVHAGILGVLLGFAAIIGDLAESIIKRSTDVKDSGHMLPGIGGVLEPPGARPVIVAEERNLPAITAACAAIGLLVTDARTLTRIAALRTDQIMSTPDGLAITLGNEPASIPAPFAELVLDHLERRPNMQTGNRPDTHWLFPSTRPGQHLTPNTVMTRLRAMGIDLQGARNAAIKALVQRVPPPIVASQLGSSPGTTPRPPDLAAVPDSPYAALLTHRAPT